MTIHRTHFFKAIAGVLCSIMLVNCTENFTPTTITIDPNNPYNSKTATGAAAADPQNPNNGGDPTENNTSSGVVGTIKYPSATSGVDTYSDGEGMLFMDNGIIRIGLNTRLGGALTYISPANMVGYFYNMVNNYDLGRQIQQAYYSDPITSNAPPPDDIAIWNPNQAGDLFRNKPPVALEAQRSGNTIYIKATPMIWALRNTPCECMMETWVELQGSVIKYKGRFTNFRGDKNFYNSHYQSIPAIFLNASYNRLVTYSGDKPFTGDALTYYSLATDKYINGNENWVALVNKSDYGIGVWSDDVYQFVSGSSNTLDGRYEDNFHENHTIPIYLDHLDHNIVYEFQSELIVGKTDDIRKYIYTKATPKKLPNYRFKKDRQHWAYVNDLKDGGVPIKNEELTIKPLNKGGQMFSPQVLWNSSDFSKIYIRMAHKTNAKTAQLFWRKFGDTKNFSDDQSITFNLIADGNYHTYELDLSKVPTWNGKIIQLLLAPFGYGSISTNDEVKLKFISTQPE